MRVVISVELPNGPEDAIAAAHSPMCGPNADPHRRWIHACDEIQVSTVSRRGATIDHL
jgi:hypothetical protein